MEEERNCQKCSTRLEAEEEGGGEESEEDVEETILMVELPGLPENFSENRYCSILGLDTSEPILQMGNVVYKGKYEDTFGSSLLFTDTGGSLEYSCKSEKKLVMERIILRDKTTSPTELSAVNTDGVEAVVDSRTETPTSAAQAGRSDDTLPTATNEPVLSGSSRGKKAQGEVTRSTSTKSSTDTLRSSLQEVNASANP